MKTFYPRVAAWPVDVLSRSLMDEPLLAAFGYRAPPAVVVRAARAGLRARARVERLLPARRTPLHARDLPRIRSHPDGCDVDALGTFPRGCPVSPDRVRRDVPVVSGGAEQPKRRVVSGRGVS